MNPKIMVKKLDSKAVIPQYQSVEAAGFDLHAIENGVVESRKTALVKTGLAVALPAGYELQVRPRSGLALKHGITVLNSPGTVDSDYRGELMVILINHSDNDFVINAGDRIAQAVLKEVVQATFEEVEELGASERGEKGFGSTGV